MCFVKPSWEPGQDPVSLNFSLEHAAGTSQGWPVSGETKRHQLMCQPREEVTTTSSEVISKECQEEMAQGSRNVFALLYGSFASQWTNDKLEIAHVEY